MTQLSDDNQLPPLSQVSGGVYLPSHHLPKVEGYQIIGKLGEGGMGTVWRATQLSTKREVALKILNPATFGSEKSRARFEREVELTARIEHPNIARVYDSGLQQGVYYYAMELVEGSPLDRYVEEHHLDQREILELLRTVCLAVQVAHQRGIIHRDLKPSNILVTADGQPHILDFGLAKALLQGDGDLAVSLTGAISGTPAFMSPEQAAGRQELDTRTDVYSLGVILYRLLTGQFPHDATGGLHQILRRIAEEDALSPRCLTSKVDKELDAILLKTLARNPEERYASAGELAREIDNYLRGEPLIARSPSGAYVLGATFRRFRSQLVTAAVVLGVLIILVVFSSFRVRREEDRALAAEHEATLAKAESMIYQGIANQLQERWPDARQHYLRAQRLLEGLGESPLPALVGISTVEADMPSPLGSFDLTLTGFTGIDLSSNSRLATLKWADKRQALLDLATGTEIREDSGWSLAVRTATPSATDRFLICGKEGFIRPPGETVPFILPGGFAVCGGENGQVILCEAQTGGKKRLLGYHGRDPPSTRLSSDGRFAISLADNRINTWPVQLPIREPLIIGPLPTTSPVQALALSSDNRLLVSRNHESNRLWVWDVETGFLLRVLAAPSHLTNICGLSFSEDSRLLLALNCSRSSEAIAAWELETGRSVDRNLLPVTGRQDSRAFRAIPVERDRIFRPGRFFQGDQYALSSDQDGSFTFWKVKQAQDIPARGFVDAMNATFSGKLPQTKASSREMFRIPAHAGYVNFVLSTNAWLAVSAGQDNFIKIWDFSRPSRAQELQSRLSNAFAKLTQDPNDGPSLSAIGEWYAFRGVVDWAVELLERAKHNGGAVSSLTLARCYWHTRNFDAATREYEVARSRAEAPEPYLNLCLQAVTERVSLPQVIEMPKYAFKGGWSFDSVTISTDGRYVLARHGSGVTAWEMYSGQEVTNLWMDALVSSQARIPSALSYLRGSKSVLNLWGNRIEAGELLADAALRAHNRQDTIRAAAFSRNKDKAIFGGDNRIVRLWDAVKGQELWASPGHSHWIWTVAISHDEKHAVSGGADGNIFLWNLKDGAQIRRISSGGDGRWVRSVAFSPDDRFILSGGDSDKLHLWDRETGAEVRTFYCGPGGGYRVGYSPDGRFVFSGGGDKAIRIWDTLSGQERLTLLGHTGSVCDIDISEDGRTLVSVAWDDTYVRVWRLEGD